MNETDLDGRIKDGFLRHLYTGHHASQSDFSIDEAGFATVIEHLISSGVHGIVIAGTTGEYYAQSMAERERMLALGTEIVAGRVAVIGGTGSIRLRNLSIWPEWRNQPGQMRFLSPRRPMPPQLAAKTR